MSVSTTIASFARLSSHRRSLLRTSGALISALVIGWASALLLPTSAQADQEPNPQLITPLNAEGMAQVSALTKALGISETQAVRDIQVERAVGDLPLAIEETLGDSYAEVWFDPWHGQFDIGVAPNTEKAVAAIRSLVAEHGVQSVTAFMPVRSTRDELRASQAGWTMRLGRLMNRGQAKAGIDAASNSVALTISSAVSESEISLLSSAVASDAVHVEIQRVSPLRLAAKPAEHQCKFIEKFRDYCDPPLFGGTEIFGPEGTPECTGGFIAESVDPQHYPDHYLLTAGHCFEGKTASESREYEIGQWASADHWAHPVAIGHLGYRYININGDAAFIDLNLNTAYWYTAHGDAWLPYVFTPGAYWGPEGGQLYAINVVGTNEQPNVQYQTPCHSGLGSGVRCGVTEETEVTAPIPYHAGIVNVGNLVYNTACTNSGDSGGPWIFNNYAMGLDIASVYGECHEGGGGSYFDDLHATDHVMGLRVVGLQGTIE